MSAESKIPEIVSVTEDGTSDIWVDKDNGNIVAYVKGKRTIIGQYTGDLSKFKDE